MKRDLEIKYNMTQIQGSAKVLKKNQQENLVLSQLPEPIKSEILDFIFENRYKKEKGFIQKFMENKARYYGFEKDGEKNGMGAEVMSQKLAYIGNHFKGKKHGMGKEINEGTKFEGKYDNGEYEMGKLITQQYQYEGKFKNNQKQGYGKLKNKVTGEMFQGGFQQNVYGGKGTLILADGTKYEGGFSQGLFNGQGKLKYANGESYRGQFKKGLKHGRGYIQMANETEERMGRWSENEQVDEEEGPGCKAAQILYLILICLLFISAIALTYAFRTQWKVFDLGTQQIGVYGAIIFLFLLIQQGVSMMNNHSWIPYLQSLAEKAHRFPWASIQTVGYREDVQLFKGNLISLRHQNYPRMRKILVGIDGNDLEDLPMVQIFEDVFPEGIVIRLQKQFKLMTAQERKQVTDKAKDFQRVCITQPHGGKRQIMYTCFHFHDDQTDLVGLTDSDTIWDLNSLTNLVRIMVGHDEYRFINQGRNNCREIRECGAVTGQVKIWNKLNYLSFLTSLRYWSAFNVERAADSYFGVVSCVSGPFGLYKKQAILNVCDEWVQQKFLGVKCTFGDDRHLTNKLLQQGMSIFYTPNAACLTDTPEELLRFIAQQTRWAKSFYREILFTFRASHKHPAWMTLELIFQFIAPFFMLTTLIYFVATGFSIFCTVIIFITLIGLLRALLNIARTCNPQFFHSIMYSLIFIFFMIPIKIFGLFTISNTEWGTSSRSARLQNVCKAIHALIYAGLYLAYLIILFFLYLFYWKDNLEQNVQLFILTTLCIFMYGFLALHFQLWGYSSLVPSVQKTMFQLYQLNDDEIKTLKSQSGIKPESMNNINQKTNGTLPTIPGTEQQFR